MGINPLGDTDTKMLQNPQVRALDNQKATLKIGERVLRSREAVLRQDLFELRSSNDCAQFVTICT